MARAAHHGEDPVAVGSAVAQAAQHDHARSPRRARSRRPRVEGLAAAVARHHAGLGEVDVQLGRQDQVDAAGQRQIALAGRRPCTPGAARPATTSTRCRPRCSGPGSRGSRTGARPRRCRRCRWLTYASISSRMREQRTAVVAVARCRRRRRCGRRRGCRARCPASSSACHAVSSSSRCCGSMLSRLARRDAEELGIEAVDAVDEAAVARGHLPRRVGVGVVPGVERSSVRAESALMASRPLAAVCHKLARSCTPPGARMPGRRWRSARAPRPPSATRARSSRISSSARLIGRQVVAGRRGLIATAPGWRGRRVRPAAAPRLRRRSAPDRDRASAAGCADAPATG